MERSVDVDENRDGFAIFGGWAECPSLDGCDGFLIQDFAARLHYPHAEGQAVGADNHAQDIGALIFGPARGVRIFGIGIDGRLGCVTSLPLPEKNSPAASRSAMSGGGSRGTSGDKSSAPR